MIRRLSYLRRVGRKSQRGHNRVITVCIYNLAEIDRASLPRDILGPIRGPPAHCLASAARAEAGLVASPPALCSPCVSGDATAGLTGSEFQTPPAAAGAARSHAHCQAKGIGTKLRQQLGTNADCIQRRCPSIRSIFALSGSGGDAQRQSLTPYSTAIAWIQHSKLRPVAMSRHSTFCDPSSSQGITGSQQ